MRCSACEAANYVRLWHLADIDAGAEYVRPGRQSTQAAFVGKAWKLATDKARELGWIV